MTQAQACRYHLEVPEKQCDNRIQAIRGVIFDLDGTLVHTHIDFANMKKRLIECCREAGIYRDDLGHLDILTLAERAVHLLEPALQEAARQELWDLLEAIELEYIPNAYLPEGAAELVQELDRAGFLLGVATRNCEKAAHRLLEKLPRVFRSIVTRENAHRTKPHPGHLLQAAEALGVDPPQTAMVGDHAMDIRAAKAAGMLAIGVLHGGDEAGLREFPPDILCHNLKEVRDALLGSDR